MRFHMSRRVLACIFVPTLLLMAGTARGMTDEHGEAAPGDEHGHTSLARAPQAAPVEKTAHSPAPSHGEAKEDATGASKAGGHTDAKPETRPTTLRMDGKPEPRTSTKPAKPMAEEVAMTADSALKALQEGNQRWVADKDENPNTEPSRRATVTEKGQKPFATILTCADSRLPVERIFDRGVGEVFVVRVAGNVAGTSETGTIEYGVEHLKTPLLVVMGHTKCGAVAAAASGTELHGALGELVSNITPAVDRVRRNNPDLDDKQVAPLAVKENVWQSITDLLKRSPEVRAAVSKREIKVVGAVCDIATGKVEWMGEHPWQSELVEAFNSRAAAANSATADAEKHDEK